MVSSSCRQSVDSLKSKNGNFRKSSYFCTDCTAKGDYRPLSRSPHASPTCSVWVCLQSELTIPQRDGQFFNGGDGGNRTPVRKHFDRNFSGRRRSFAFPHPGAGRHARGFGSFMMRGAGKAYCTHVPHSSTLPPGPWASRVERSLIKQREEQCYRCSLIYKRCPF